MAAASEQVQCPGNISLACRTLSHAYLTAVPARLRPQQGLQAEPSTLGSKLKSSQWLIPGPSPLPCQLTLVGPSTGLILGPVTKLPQVTTDTSLTSHQYTPFQAASGLILPGPTEGTLKSPSKSEGRNHFKFKNRLAFFWGREVNDR